MWQLERTATPVPPVRMLTFRREAGAARWHRDAIRAKGRPGSPAASARGAGSGARVWTGSPPKLGHSGQPVCHHRFAIATLISSSMRYAEEHLLLATWRRKCHLSSGPLIRGSVLRRDTAESASGYVPILRLSCSYPNYGAYLGSRQNLKEAVNDRPGIDLDR
jgi:hypothetical protein